jgi:hypothetical protein
MPNSDSAESHGTCGCAAYLPTSVSGGARSADELIAHAKVNSRKSGAAPCGATKGSSRKAKHDTRVTPRTMPLSLPKTFAVRSAATPMK